MTGLCVPVPSDDVARSREPLTPMVQICRHGPGRRVLPGRALFFHVHSPGITYAVTGPWGKAPSGAATVLRHHVGP